jgi:hypothetical protein
MSGGGPLSVRLLKKLIDLAENFLADLLAEILRDLVVLGLFQELDSANGDLVREILHFHGVPLFPAVFSPFQRLATGWAFRPPGSCAQ